MRLMTVLFLVLMFIFSSRIAYSDEKCWFVEVSKTYNYEKNVEDNEPPLEERVKEKMNNMFGVRLLFKESGELLKVLGFFADGNYSFNKYKYPRSKSKPCPPEHPTEIKRPGDWSKYEETSSGNFVLEDPHAGGVFMKLGNYYQLDVGVSKLIWKTQNSYKEQHYDACTGKTTKNNKSWSGETDVTKVFGHIPIMGQGGEDGYKDSIFKSRERDKGKETVSIKWNIRKISCDCKGLNARLVLTQGDVKVNGKQVTGSTAPSPLDVGGGVIQTGKRSRAKITLGDDIAIHLDSNSIIDLSTICEEKRKKTFLDMIKGKIYVLLNELGHRDHTIKVHASSAVIGVRGKIQSPEKIYLASIDPLSVVLAMEENRKDQTIEEIRPEESEINKAKQAFFVDLVPYDHLYLKAEKGKIKISIGSSEKILSNGEELYITLQMPEKKEEIVDISIEPITK